MGYVGLYGTGQHELCGPRTARTTGWCSAIACQSKEAFQRKTKKKHTSSGLEILFDPLCDWNLFRLRYAWQMVHF